MALTKRTRFEVLRRDNHTCRYCHATDQPLTVDHVTPTALGGTDDPSNLVAACRDCNAGKSSTSPDAALVADVRQDALRHAELVAQSYRILVEQMGARDEYVDAWQESYTYGLPDNWRNSIGRWFEMGVPLELLVDAAEKACAKTKTFRGTERFTYMCGIVWSQVRMVDELAQAKLHIDGQFMSEEAISEFGYEAWNAGAKNAYKNADRIAIRNDVLSVVIDKIDYVVDPWAVTR